jgi:hypothetical protein
MQTAETACKMDRLLAAIQSDNHAAIRAAARAVLHAAFSHLFYDVKIPCDGDGLAMATLIVAAGEQREFNREIAADNRN